MAMDGVELPPIADFLGREIQAVMPQPSDQELFVKGLAAEGLALCLQASLWM